MPKHFSLLWVFRNMEEQYQYRLTLLVFVTLSLLSTAISENDNKAEAEGFDYIQGSARGPERWGDLREEWAKCKDGSIQSPIALNRGTAKVNPELGELHRSYNPGEATLKNNRHQIAVEWAGTVGSIQINGIDYLLRNYHWHHPSEHTINGERFELELHMVHSANNPDVSNKTAVVAVLFRFGLPDPFLSKIGEGLKRLKVEEKDEIKMGSLNPLDAIADNHPKKNYYTYLGSLTTPPCSEPVIWTIMEQVGSVLPDQVELLRSSVDDGAKKNARPLQELNHRDVFFYQGQMN